MMPVGITTSVVNISGGSRYGNYFKFTPNMRYMGGIPYFPKSRVRRQAIKFWDLEKRNEFAVEFDCPIGYLPMNKLE